MLLLVVVGCISAVRQPREATTASGVIMQLPPTGRHRCWTGLFHPQREADHYAKTTEGTRSILMSSVAELPISMGNSCNYCEHIRASSGDITFQLIKPSNPFTNVCWVSVLTTFSAPPQILLHRCFLRSIPETKKWCVMVSFGATAAGLFWTVNVCWAHPVISRASAVASSIFHGVILMLFEVRRTRKKLNKP